MCRVAPQAGNASIILTIFFIVNFAYSWGPICWVYVCTHCALAIADIQICFYDGACDRQGVLCSRSYPAEIFPMRVRAKAVSITTTGNWITNTIFNTLTPKLISHAGANGTFCFFGALAAPTNAFLAHLFDCRHLATLLRRN